VTRRVTVVALAGMLFALCVAPSASAAGATYKVVQCDPLNRGQQAVFEANLAYDARSFCANTAQEHAIQVNNTNSAGFTRFGRASWSVPSSALGIVGVEVQGKLRRDHGHRSRLFMGDENLNETIRVATGGTGPTGFDPYTWTGSRQESFVASLSCEEADGCAQSNLAKTWIRHVELTLADYSDPLLVDVSGSLLASGWLRGSRGLFVSASDQGGGLAQIGATVNGTEIADEPSSCTGQIQGTSLASRISPCAPGDQLGVSAVDTAAPPFADGTNLISICATDFAGNRTCQSRTISVDNSAPSLAFSSTQVPDDPDLIRAPTSDPHSGVESARIYFRPAGSGLWQPLETQLHAGELRARVDSGAVPPGEYEFMAEATDVAGNRAETTLRENGQQMKLTFPLKASVDLTADLKPGGAKRQTVAYGRDSAVAGRLLSANGTGLSNRDVTVVEYFGEGALIDRRVRTVETDGQGHWSSKLPAGPSRSVTAYFAGDLRHLSAETEAGSLRVRTRASFRTSRRRVPEGEKIVFKGKVRHVGARIPVGGKLIELQVQEGAGRWNTVREAFYTKPSGRYRLAYRFGRFYLADAVFRFRAKVAREQGWPYKAPVRSRTRRVTVLAD
jgi:hypothetical protein